MSSIHYKLKSTLEYKTLTFDGLHISVDDLKKMIFDKENIRTESFDLVLTNTHTKRQYTSEELVPRNSSVIVQRIPRVNAIKLPKVQDTSTSGIVNRNSGSQSQESAHIMTEEYLKMTEEERISHVKEQSTQKYQQQNYHKKTSGILTGPPPPTYICNRCSQPGHWFKACPLLNTKRTTGIPMEELMETTQDDPLAMMHPSGKYVVPIMHHNARLQRKQEQVGLGGGGTPKEAVDEMKEIPPELSCRLCKNLLREAMLAVCCGDSFCADCMQQRMLADPYGGCPGDSCHEQISTDALVPNKKIREAVHKFLTSSSVSTGEKQQPPQMHSSKPESSSHSLLHKLLPDLAPPSSSPSVSSAVLMPGYPNAQYSNSQSLQQQQPQQQQTMRVEFQPSIPIRSFNSLPTNSMLPPKEDLQQAQPIYPTKVELTFPPPNFSVPPPIIPQKIVQPISALQTSSPSGVSANNEFSSAWEKLLKGKIESPQQAAPLTIIATDQIQAQVPLVQQFHAVTSTTVVKPTAVNRQPPIPGSEAEVEEADSSTPAPNEPSKEINDAWESFLKRKDEEKKKRTPASNHSTDSSSSSNTSSNSSRSSSSSSASSGSRKRYPRHSSRKGSPKDRREHYSSRSRKSIAHGNYSSGIRAQYSTPGQILYGQNYMTNVGAAGFGQPMLGYQQLYNSPYSGMQQGMGQPYHYQPNFRRGGPPHRFDNRRDSLLYRGRPQISPDRRSPEKRGKDSDKKGSPRDKSLEKSKRIRSKERRDTSKTTRESSSRRSRSVRDKEPKEKSTENRSRRHSSREKVDKNMNKSKTKVETEKVSTKKTEERPSKENKKSSNKSKSRSSAKSEKKAAEGADTRKRDQKPYKKSKEEKPGDQEEDEEEEDEIERIIQETKHIKQIQPADPFPQKAINIFENLALRSMPQTISMMEKPKVVEKPLIEENQTMDDAMDEVISSKQHQPETMVPQEQADKLLGEETQLESSEKELEVSEPHSSPMQQSAHKQEEEQQDEGGEDKESRKKKEKKRHKHKHHQKQEKKKKKKHKHSRSRSSTPSHSKTAKDNNTIKKSCLVRNQLDDQPGLMGGEDAEFPRANQTATSLTQSHDLSYSSKSISTKSDSEYKPSKNVRKSNKEQEKKKEIKQVDHQHHAKSSEKVSKISDSHKSRDKEGEKSSSREQDKKQASSRRSVSKRKSPTEEDTRRQLKRHKSSKVSAEERSKTTEVKEEEPTSRFHGKIQLFYD